MENQIETEITSVKSKNECRAIFLIPVFDAHRIIPALELISNFRINDINCEFHVFYFLDMDFLKTSLNRFRRRNFTNPRILKVLKAQHVTVKKHFMVKFPYLKKVKSLESGILDSSGKFENYIYSGVADEINSIFPDTKRDKRIIKKYLKDSKSLFRWINGHHLENNSTFYIFNGRYHKEKTINLMLRAKSLTTRILEYGNESILIWNNAQSVEELTEKANEFYRHNLEAFGHQPIKDFFEKNRKEKSLILKNWGGKMKEGKLPSINRNKKVFVFYSSSQIEFIGNGDTFSENEFRDQKQAFKAITDELKKTNEDWKIFLRLHPLNPKYRDSGDELRYWDDVLNFPNLECIHPNSDIDSYALASRATLTANFGSNIGAEIIYFGLAPSVSLCKTPWAQSFESGLLNSQELLENYFKLGEFKLYSKNTVYPYALFNQIGGSKYNFIQKGKSGHYYYFGEDLVRNN